MTLAPPHASKLYYTCLNGLLMPAGGFTNEGEDINEQGGEYGNALQAASFKGYYDIVILLLDNGAAFNAQGDRYGDILQRASSEDHHEIVKLLLNNDAGVNTQDGKYGNALQAVSSNGCQEIVIC
ncbi:Pfs NACHT and ankyrin domain protein [Penicillium waksmanii]|uniref:Pfs NACHT and ankyrin domain protein n=1 Tax=Penicillium waksmanii TaxID=69791 RepID=UPI002547298C|nr:Pfs NACHT and ankyrin domain protein [Penicillium waksmanii]KAJ5988234.1 Pfs NACHT and ankyrin domain protein [Penicillium waksmanii]